MTARWHALIGFAACVLLFGMPCLLPGGSGPVFCAAPEVSSLKYDETTLYAPGARRFADTGSPAWELDVVELAGERFSYPILHQVVMGSLAKCTGSVEVAFQIGHALLPACAWLAFFMLARLRGTSAEMSGLCAWLVTVIAAAPRNAMLLGADSFRQALEFSRTPHPALSTLVLAMSMLVLVRALSRPGWRAACVAGVLFGVLFYTYYFHAVAGWTALGVIWLVALVSRRPAWRQLTVVAATGLVTGLPWIIWTATSMRSGITRELMGRIGIFSRAPDWAGLAGLGVCLALTIWTARRWWNSSGSRWLTAHVLSALLVGAFVVTNLHLITGYNAQHEHAYNRIVQPFGLLLILTCVRVPRAVWMAPLISCAVFALGVIRQTCVAAYEQKQRVPQAVLEALNRLDGSLVVATLDSELRGELPVLTRHWSFVPYGCRTLASNEEILRRYALVARLAGLSKERALAVLHEKPAAGLLRNECWDLLVSYELRASDAVLFEQAWDSMSDVAAALRSRRMDVLLLRADEPPPAAAGLIFAPLFESPGWRAWRLSSASSAQP